MHVCSIEEWGHVPVGGCRHLREPLGSLYAVSPRVQGFLTDHLSHPLTEMLTDAKGFLLQMTDRLSHPGRFRLTGSSFEVFHLCTSL